jgi:hypothetical protein
MRLTQVPAAFALGLGLLAVPGIPLIADALLPERESDVVGPNTEVDLLSMEGNVVVVSPPPGWTALDNGDSATLRDDQSFVLVQVYDLLDRDPAAVAARVMRANRFGGISAALDGGQVRSDDGTLSGETCVVVTAEETGTCVFVADDDVVISVLSIGADAPPVTDIVERISRGQQ